jgi:hypothetical protein
LSTTGPGRALDEIGNALRLIDLDHRFGHRFQQRGLIQFLKIIAIADLGWRRRRDRQHRHGVRVGGCQARYQIGDAGAGRGIANPNPSRNTGKCIGHMRRRLFMTHQDMLNGIFPEERVVEAKTVARYSEYMGYAKRFQQLYEGIPALHFHVFCSRSVALRVKGRCLSSGKICYFGRAGEMLCGCGVHAGKACGLRNRGYGL